MKVVILAGGRGTRLSEETHAIPKPMVSIGERPILWHIMNHYAQFGFNDFVVALGYKGYVIKEYFANYLLHEADMTVDLLNGDTTYLTRPRQDWRVTLVDTGLDSMTGGRLGRLSHLLTERFLLTYGDGLSDVRVDDVVAFHDEAGALATVTAVSTPARFGALSIQDQRVIDFSEKPNRSGDRINGGYFVVEPDVLSLITGDDCIFEREPLTTLARRGQLAAYQHTGFWMPMDTLRERDELIRMWESGQAPWASR
jgi:glucose-1-phosphate cytidylyltransferase